MAQECACRMSKMISIVIPCYNEVENVIPISKAVEAEMNRSLSEYEFEIIFIDNCSTDGTRDKLRLLCEDDKNVKAILNSRNFGQFNSPYYGLLQANGDCSILLCCDFQDPVELIPVFVHEWEAGYKVVSGIKISSRENRIMYFLRSCYYKLIRKMSDVEQIEHFTGFGLYDQSFLNTLRALDDPKPFLRGIVAELGPASRKDIEYEQAERKAGRTHNNWATLYDAAMLSFTSYTKGGLRVATIMGFVCSIVALTFALVYLILKLMNWNAYPAGTIPILLAVLVLGSFQLFFIGLLGEYVMNMNGRVMKRPLVVEEERLGFWDALD